jgi:DNA-binding response OmpR family regulator
MASDTLADLVDNLMDILIGSRDAVLRRRTASSIGETGDRVVTTSKSGKVLVEALDRDFGLIIIDTFVQGLDGRETLTILRQVRPRATVLYLHRSEEDVSNLESSGGGRLGTLVRTAGKSELIAKVKKLTSRGPESEIVSQE